ncbi:MAG: flavin reductase [Bacteroidales bacterium]|nr:flavin reductase [Bacteroidales bacterium]
MKHTDNFFETINPAALTDNFIKAIGDGWMLITAGEPDNFNTMTASWGTIGVLWNMPVAICFIRPTRYTYNFAEQNDLFTLCFFESSDKKILQFCGSNSGRNVDKIKATGLIPVETNNGAIIYEQSRLAIECRKIYFDDIKPENFLMADIDKSIYPDKDYHRIYIGKIVGCYIKK